MIDTNKHINQALKAEAMVVGASCEIKGSPNYLPLQNNLTLHQLLENNANTLIGAINV